MSATAPRVRAPMLAARLALQDLWHDRRVSGCLVAALAATIAPLLLLLGLRTGVIETLRDKLLEDPRNLEVWIRGNWHLAPEWFDAMRGDPDVGFVLPLTRSLNAQVDLVVDARRFASGVEVLPSAAGDPLLLRSGIAPPSAFGELLLSTAVAETLGVAAGDAVTARVQRRRAGRDEIARLPMRVVAVLPEALLPRSAVMASLDFLLAIEDFRDGAPSPRLGVADGTPLPPRTAYARARLYAVDLDAVPRLAQRVRAQNIDVDTRAQEIETVQALDRVFGIVFGVIAALGGVGAAAAMAGSFLANVDRKRRDLAFMRLCGFAPTPIALFPGVQALVIGALAFALALAAYMLGAAAFDALLAPMLQTGARVCRLGPVQGLAAAAATTLVAVLAAVAAGLRALRVDPAESLRAL